MALCSEQDEEIKGTLARFIVRLQVWALPDMWDTWAYNHSQHFLPENFNAPHTKLQLPQRYLSRMRRTFSSSRMTEQAMTNRTCRAESCQETKQPW